MNSFFTTGLLVSLFLLDDIHATEIIHNLRSNHLYRKDQRTLRSNEWESRIVGGSDATEGEFPFFVQGLGCGASLIWKDIVLTAAHCKGFIADAEGRVLVGATTQNTETENSEWVKVQTNGEITHPEYDGDVYKDYMIVVLDKEVTNENVGLVGLAGDSTTLTPGEPLTVMGFGALYEDGPGSETLQQVQVDYVSRSKCNSIYESDSEYDPSVMFCAGGTAEGGKDSCQGDSGGPLVNEENVQVGIVSWGYGCAQPDTPGVYATVAAEIEWIKDMVCANAANPPEWACNGSTSPVPASVVQPMSLSHSLGSETPEPTLMPTTEEPTMTEPTQPPVSVCGDDAIMVSLQTPNGPTVYCCGEGGGDFESGNVAFDFDKCSPIAI